MKKSYRILALETEEALNKKILKQTNITESLKTQLSDHYVFQDASYDACPDYINKISELSRSVVLNTLESKNQ